MKIPQKKQKRMMKKMKKSEKTAARTGMGLSAGYKIRR